MKAIVLIFAFIVASIAAHAQFGRPVKMLLAVGDTAKNTTPVNKILTASAGYNAVAIQPVITKQSGTVAGKAYLYESLDAVNYLKTDSITLSDQATNTAIWAKQTTPYGFYKVNVVGSGTMQALVSVWYVFRKNISQ